MNYQDLLKQLLELEKCSICSKPYDKPVRIKTCGHYFCLKCINISKEECPGCNEHFDKLDIDFKNTLIKLKPMVSNLKEILKNLPQTKQPAPAVITLEEPLKGDVLDYFGTQFRVTYNNSSSKLNAKGESPLHLLCKRKKLEEIQDEVEQGVDINFKDFAGWTPLHEAVEVDSLEIVKLLLKKGAIINCPGGNYVTPLHKAVIKENKTIIKLLLKYGANVNAIDFSGCKPIDYTKNKEIQALLTADYTISKIPLQLCVGKKITVYCHSISEDNSKKLLKSDKAYVKKEFNIKKYRFTHFIVKKTHKISLKIMIAMLEGLYFAPEEWIDNFITDNYFVPIPTYTFVLNEDLNNGIRKSMMNFLLKKPKLFHGINFFITQHLKPIELFNTSIDKQFLNNLIVSGGGQVLKRAPAVRTIGPSRNYPYHANKQSDLVCCCNYIIFEDSSPPELQYQMPELKHKSSKWLINCVQNFAIQD